MNTQINGTISQAGIDLPAQSHASYEASALPPSHHGWINLDKFVILVLAKVTKGIKCKTK